MLEDRVQWLPDERGVTGRRYGGHRGVIAEMRKLARRREPYVLCLVALTQGSTYRKPGALAVIAASGEAHGVISGGCLESELQRQALDALQSGAPRSIAFDTRGDDDVLFGSGSGCRGTMHVLLVPVREWLLEGLSGVLMDADRQHELAELVLVLDGPEIASGWCWTGGREYALGTAPLDLRALRSSAPGGHLVRMHAAQARCARLNIAVSPSLLLIGASPEAPALIRIAHEMGWVVTVIDHRPAAIAAIATLAERTLLARPSAALAQIHDQAMDACVIMTHTAANDLDALQALAGRNVRYIGLLGPPMRRDELLGQLDEQRRAALSGRLHAPVGLDLGGHGAEALALSIAAQLQQCFAASL